MSNLKAIKRDSTSSGANNKLRSEGLIPAILYGGKEANQNISVQKKDLKNLVNSDTFLSKVLELDIDGKKEKVIPRDVSFHVVSEEPIHIDFMRIVAGKKIIFKGNIGRIRDIKIHASGDLYLLSDQGGLWRMYK